MKPRTALLALLATALFIGLLGRARRSAVPSQRSVPRRGRWKVRVIALSGVALGAAVVAAVAIAVATAQFGSAEESQADAQVERAITGAAPTPPPTPTRPAEAPTLSASPSVTTWRLLAGGDVLMDLTEADGVDPFAGIVPPLASADLAAVNVEMAIATGGTPWPKSFVFRAPPSAAQTMAAAGIDVGNLGNNHSLDYGLDALFETMASLRAAGVASVGAGANEAEAYAPATFDVASARVAVIGASRVFPHPSWAAAEHPGLASAYAESRLVEAVRSAKTTHDVVIVMVHWGEESVPCPNDDQQRLGAALIDAGAAVVLGSHPHVLQPVVQRSGGIIAYSLGNFVWRPRSGPTGETGVLEVSFEGARVIDYRFYPHVLDQRGAPVPAAPAAAARIQAAVGSPCAWPTSIWTASRSGLGIMV